MFFRGVGNMLCLHFIKGNLSFTSVIRRNVYHIAPALTILRSSSHEVQFSRTVAKVLVSLLRSLCSAGLVKCRCN
jgi:hypothetical protein